MAISWHHKALRVFNALNDRHRAARTKFDLGVCYSTLECFDEAITAFQESITELREVGARDSEGLADRNLGIACERAGRLAEARTAWKPGTRLVQPDRRRSRRQAHAGVDQRPGRASC